MEQLHAEGTCWADCRAARLAAASGLAPPPAAAPQPVTLADGGCSMRAEMAAERRLGGSSTDAPAFAASCSQLHISFKCTSA